MAYSTNDFIVVEFPHCLPTLDFGEEFPCPFLFPPFPDPLFAPPPLPELDVPEFRFSIPLKGLDPPKLFCDIDPD